MDDNHLSMFAIISSTVLFEDDIFLACLWIFSYVSDTFVTLDLRNTEPAWKPKILIIQIEIIKIKTFLRKQKDKNKKIKIVTA